jgi:DNA-binding transcriptional LysR family regulator
MDLRHLRYFVAVAEAGHMTRAAARLGIQQPPLSMQIRALEAALGAPLFERHPKGVALTDAGRLLLPEAQRILADVAALESRMAQAASGLRGTLSIGFTSSSAAHAFTPETLRACRERYPDIEILLSEHNAAEITEAVVARRLHCGFLRVPVARPPGVRFETLLAEPVVVALPVGHRLAHGPAIRRAPVAPGDLDGENLILVRRPGAPGLYANLLAICEAAGAAPNVVAEVERMMTSLNLVAAGAGVTVIPASMQGAHPHAIVYRPFERHARLDAPITLVFREAESNRSVDTFLDLARSIARRWRAASTPARRAQAR